LKNTFKRLI